MLSTLFSFVPSEQVYLDQGIVAFHLGRDKEAKPLLEKVNIEMQLLTVDEVDLMEIVRLVEKRLLFSLYNLES